MLSDGTGNSSAALFRTNVWRLYKALDLRDTKDPETPRQFALYDDGVGASMLWPIRALGGAFGWGLSRNVRELYAFVCRTYEPGDRIYAFGFSRGAFTVRIVVGLILRQGLVVYEGDESKLARDVAAAYRAYRKERFETVIHIEFVARAVRDFVIDLRNRARGYDSYATVKQKMKLAGRHEPSVAFIGVWDTVAAYGLPVQELTRAVDRLVWPLSMPDADLGQRVGRAMHALSLDDERQTFHPELWNEGRPPKEPDKAPPNEGRGGDRIDQERLSQVWFAGVHADVGGGYPDDAVSYVPLQWIMEGACLAGLRFTRRIRADYAVLSDENGVVHHSRTGVASYYRYTPRRIERLARPQRTTGELRKVAIERVKIHESALRRIQVGQDGYATIAPPPDFDVVTINNQIIPAERYLQTPNGSSSFDQQAFGEARERVYNLVWLRRVAYFWTFAATMLLAAMPAIWPAKPDGVCLSSLCFAAPLMTPIKAVAPALAAPWLDSFSSNPWPFTILIGALALGMAAGSSLEGSIADGMRLVWACVPQLRPAGTAQFPPPPEAGAVTRAIQDLRLSRGYRSAFKILTRWILPGLALLAAGALAVMLSVKTAHEIRSSFGAICVGSDDWTRLPAIAAGAPARVDFSTSERCKPIGFRLEEGATYRLSFAIPPGLAWRDASLPAGPYGLDPETWATLKRAPALPLRRHLLEGWFQPIARIGSLGNDAYALRPDPSVPHRTDAQSEEEAAQGPAFAATITARQSGELFLYVNDAVGWSGFYANNHGGARVSVERVEPRPAD
ncbi:hypothetical protein GCM10008179_34340 [Hansschlegelia plantiphila]|uniref:T6SS Phospholipase effector Tle1-like catalytic domain-containing protein n=1 Tax=Hansschlegelia plantiphila TaxID=374655 RepID=A0A9W6J2U5_9HYPH|nr:hypothetical protein GCM10008179_34340 [Hansschlegelia plantiphila]